MSDLARTANRTGTYAFALRHGTTVPVLRTNGVGTVELHDEQTLLCQQAALTRRP